MYLLTFNTEKGNSKNIMYWKEVIEKERKRKKLGYRNAKQGDGRMEEKGRQGRTWCLE